MMKKEYVQPAIEVIRMKVQQQLMAGSGLNAGDQNNPGMPGSGAPQLTSFDDELDMD